jgi:uncharacterized protein
MGRSRLLLGTAVVTAVLALTAPPAGAAEFPKPTGYLVDDAGAVPDAEQRALEAELAAYATRSGHQVAVAVVRSTGNESIEDYANDLFGHWGVGSAERDDGVLLVVATEDRKLRIEVGRGLEGTLTDVESADIIRDDMVPSLRAGNVGEAVRAGERGVRSALGDPTPEAGGETAPAAGFGGFGGGETAPRSQGGFGLLPLLVLGVLAFGLLSSLGGRRRRRRRRRGGMFFPVFLGSGWGGGWGSGGGFSDSSGGGFGGFGGGGSGGGGASGSW